MSPVITLSPLCDTRASRDISLILSAAPIVDAPYLHCITLIANYVGRLYSLLVYYITRHFTLHIDKYHFSGDMPDSTYYHTYKFHTPKLRDFVNFASVLMEEL